MKRLQRLRNDESGMSYVFVGLGLMALMSATMLAIDVGMLMTARSQAQNSADAAALAGAVSLAFDSWDDRTPTGPAVTNAITYGKQNRVQPNPKLGESGDVSITPADITFPTDPVTGEANRVHATVWRAGGHAGTKPVPTLIAKYFGVKTVDIGASATAEASPANAMTCVKPFTIPDKWREMQTPAWDPDDTFARYYETGVKKGQLIGTPDVYVPAYDGTGKVNPDYTGYNTEANRGMRMTLHASNGANIAPSLYFSLAMTDDTGGADYDWNIANCNHTIYHWDDPLVQEPGAKEGPTIDGIEQLIAKDPRAYWDTGCNCVKGSAYGDRQSPRIFPIPLFDPDYYQGGKTNGRVATLKVANWIGYFVEYIGGTTIYGRIIPIAGIRDKYGISGNPAFPRAIRLVQ
jgi:Putative Flp pilus-assembly TadE/G-like